MKYKGDIEGFPEAEALKILAEHFKTDKIKIV